MTSKEAFRRLKFIADNELNTGSKSYKDLQEFWNYKEPLKVITDLVERDTPMKVINGTTVNGVCLDYKCPSCKQEIDNSGYYPDQYYLIKHCISCGQRLDWSE